MSKDLRTFLEVLEKAHPDQVLNISKEVDPVFEATGIVAKLEKENRFPVVIFHKIRGSEYPAVVNMHADYHRLATALGLPFDAKIQDFVARYTQAEAHPILPVMVTSEEAPVHEVVRYGDEVDLNELPLLKYHEKDAGKYITCGFIQMKDPDTKIRNVGIYRLMLQRKNELGIMISQTAHGHYIMKKFRNRGQTMQFAVSIGHHPGFNIGCMSFVPYGFDEITVAGAILGEPVRMVKCKTIDFEVPADAEITLECEMHPDEFREEAPFGEYPGTYGPQRMNPVVHVKAITMRNNPYYQSCFVGHPDNLYLAGLPRNTQIMRAARMASPTVTAVNMPLSGRCRFICYVAMDKLIEGDPKNVAMAVLAADSYLKYVVVVDKDVDVMSDFEVCHAIGTRLRADTDVFVVKNARGSPLDPASYDPQHGSHLVTKVGIDATRKSNALEEISVPGLDQIDLADYAE